MREIEKRASECLEIVEKLGFSPSAVFRWFSLYGAGVRRVARGDQIPRPQTEERITMMHRFLKKAEKSFRAAQEGILWA